MIQSIVKFILALCCCSFCFQGISQAKMNKLFIEDDHYFFVELDSLNKNGLIVRNHIDSLSTDKSSITRYLNVGPTERYNHSKINYYIYHNSFYSLGAYKILDHFPNFFVKVDYSEANKMNDSKIKRKIALLKALPLKRQNGLAMYRTPLEKNANYTLRGVKKYSILYDIAYVDSMKMVVLVYNEWTKELEKWEHAGEVIKTTDITAGFKETKWKLSDRYILERPLNKSFTSFVLDKKVYFINNDGIIYLASKQLLETGKLPEGFGYLVVNKDKGEIFYILKENFKIGEYSMNELLIKYGTPVLIR